MKPTSEEEIFVYSASTIDGLCELMEASGEFDEPMSTNEPAMNRDDCIWAAKHYIGSDPVKVKIGSTIVSRIRELGYGKEEWRGILIDSQGYPDHLQLVLLKSIRSGLSKEVNLRKKNAKKLKLSLDQQQLFDTENY